MVIVYDSPFNWEKKTEKYSRKKNPPLVLKWIESKLTLSKNDKIFDADIQMDFFFIRLTADDEK